MPEISYDQIEALEDELEPWANFLQEEEGSEIGDYIAALRRAIDCASSAAYYDHAYAMLNLLKEIIDNARQEANGGWVEDMVEQNQYGWERQNERLAKDYQHPYEASPQGRLEALLKADAERP